MRRIGLIGGTSWESTAPYYAQLNQGVRGRLGGHHSADLVLRSVDFAEIAALQSAGDWSALASRYGAESASLARAGAEVIGILANTMHLVYDDVVAGAPGAEVVHIVEAVADAGVSRGLTCLGLLGTRYTMESASLYPPRLAARGISTVVPGPDDIDAVHRIVYDELVHGLVSESSRGLVRGVIDRLVERGAQAVVLGCTELMLLLDPADPSSASVPLLDSMSLHVNALLDAALAPSATAVLSEEGAA